MSYQPTQWLPGDLITAPKLNHLENGVTLANNVQVLEAHYDDITDAYLLNATYNQIVAAILDYQLIQFKCMNEETGVLTYSGAISAYTEPDDDNPSITLYKIRIHDWVFQSEDPDGVLEG